MANQAYIQEESWTISNFIGSCHEQSIHLTWTISFSGTFKQYWDHLNHGDSLEKYQIHEKSTTATSTIQCQNVLVMSARMWTMEEE